MHERVRRDGKATQFKMREQAVEELGLAQVAAIATA